MPSNPMNPSIQVTRSGSRPVNRLKPPAIPTFAELAADSIWKRIQSNVATCLAASPRGVTAWRFAPMLRSAYLPKTFPTRPLLESVLLHVIALTALLSVPPSPAPQRVKSEVGIARAERRIIYYSPIDPLPPISPLGPTKPPQQEPPRRPARVRLAFHPTQRIVSRPPLPDSSRQTIVQPEAPQVRLPADVPIPNIVAWMPLPKAPLPPAPPVRVTRQESAQTRVPRLLASTAAAPTPLPPKLTLPAELVPPAPLSDLPKAPLPPAPLVRVTRQESAQVRVPRLLASTAAAPTPVQPKLSLPAVSVPAPPVSELPKVPVAPAPLVRLTRQASGQVPAPRAPVPVVAAPTPLPPAILPSTATTGLPTLVAVSIAPAPPPPRVPIRIPLGNRSGEFAVSPEGDKELLAFAGQPGGDSDARESVPELPNVGEIADIRVPHLSIAGDRTSAMAEPIARSEPEPATVPSPPSSPAPPPARDLRVLMARAAWPSLLPDAPRSRGIKADTDFFGGQHAQTTYINMPNLTSGVGSWILRFAEHNGAGTEEGAITSPVAIKKVDPKYAPSAIRDRVEGTVTLAAQILRDGTVAGVEVVRGLDPRLDLSAVQALTLWQFAPARKKGIPIDLDVLVQIPFRLPAF